MKIEGCVAMVTGANRGLGKALVVALVDAGAAKVYAGARDERKVEASSRVIPVTIDTTKPEQIAAATTKANDVTLLINNAGIMSAFDLLTTTQLEADVRTNFHGTLDVIKAFVPVLERANGATIVNVLSIAALASIPSMGGYCATKAAAYSMTLALRPPLKAKRIELLAALPGPVDTDMSKAFPISKASPAAVAEGILEGISRGDEEIYPDPSSRQMSLLWNKSPKELERALAGF